MKSSLLLASVVAAACLASQARAGTFSAGDSAYWSESWTNSSGGYISPASNTSVNGSGQLVAPIPTNANQASPENDVVNYVRTRSDLAGASAFYNGTLLGDLSGKTALSATFSLNNSTLSAGQQFQLSQLVGDGTTSNAAPVNPGLRLFFSSYNPTTGSPLVNANGIGDMEPNSWWSNPAAAFVTSMNNGQDVTLTVNFDPSLWTNYDGKVGTDAAVSGQFLAALTDVNMLGISFGSGYFFSNGFAFNTPGQPGGSLPMASLNLDSIETVGQAVPVPAAVWGGGALLGLMAGTRIIRRKRQA